MSYDRPTVSPNCVGITQESGKLEGSRNHGLVEALETFHLSISTDPS